MDDKVETGLAELYKVCEKSRVQALVSQEVKKALDNKSSSHSRRSSQSTVLVETDEEDVREFTKPSEARRKIEVKKRPRLDVFPPGLSAQEMIHLLRCNHINLDTEVEQRYRTMYDQIRAMELLDLKVKPPVPKDILAVTKAKVSCGIMSIQESYVSYKYMLVSLMEYIDQVDQEVREEVVAKGYNNQKINENLQKALKELEKLLPYEKMSFLSRSKYFANMKPPAGDENDGNIFLKQLHHLRQFMFWFRYDCLIELYCFSRELHPEDAVVPVHPQIMMNEWTYKLLMAIDDHRRKNNEKKQELLEMEFRLNNFILNATKDISDQCKKECDKFKKKLPITVGKKSIGESSQSVTLAALTSNSDTEVVVVSDSDDDIKVLDEDIEVIGEVVKDVKPNPTQLRSSLPSSPTASVKSSGSRTSLPNSLVSMRSGDQNASSQVVSSKSRPVVKPRDKQKKDLLKEIDNKIDELKERIEEKKKFIQAIDNQLRGMGMNHPKKPNHYRRIDWNNVLKGNQWKTYSVQADVVDEDDDDIEIL